MERTGPCIEADGDCGYTPAASEGLPNLLAVAAEVGRTLPVVTVVNQRFWQLLVFQAQNCLKPRTSLIKSNVWTW